MRADGDEHRYVLACYLVSEKSMSRETFNPATLSKHMHLSNMFAAICSPATGPEQAFVLANQA